MNTSGRTQVVLLEKAESYSEESLRADWVRNTGVRLMNELSQVIDTVDVTVSELAHA